MAKKAKAKKAASTTRLSGEAAVKQRETVLHLLMRKSGVTLPELKEAGHNQAAASLLRMAENRGLKTKTAKEEGELTRYFATGTLSAPMRKPKAAAKKKVAKKAKKAKAAAPKRRKAPEAEAESAEASASA